MLSLRPDVVTIDYSLNDRGFGLNATRAAWAEMIEAAQAQGAKVLLLTPTPDTSVAWDDPADALAQHAQQVRDLAAQYEVGLVDSLAAFAARVAEGVPLADLMSVSVHPNAAGHEIVAGELIRWFA